MANSTAQFIGTGSALFPIKTTCAPGEQQVKIASYAFGFRRKTLKKSLSNLDVDINQLADLCGIDLGLRAQNLSIDDFSNLALGYEKLSKQIVS